MELIRTKDDAISYLFDKRDNMRSAAQQANDLHNEDGAKILRLVADQLTASIRYIVDIPFSN